MPGHAPPATVQPPAASGRAHGLSVAASRDHGLASPAASGVSGPPAVPGAAPAVSIPAAAGSAAGVLGSGCPAVPAGSSMRSGSSGPSPAVAGCSGRRQVSSSGLPPLGVVTPSDATNAPAGRPPDASITATPARTPGGWRSGGFRTGSAGLGPVRPVPRIEPAGRSAVSLLLVTDPAIRAPRDDDRVVDLSDDFVVLPEQTSDDTDRGWGERPGGNDDWLLAERPPHWG